MSDMNLCIFEGNLTRDPELKTISGKEGDVSVVRFTIGVNSKRGKQERATFVDCEAWDSGAEAIAKYFERGKPIRVFAEHVTDVFDGQDGKKVYRQKFRVKEFFFVNRGTGTGQGEEGSPTPVEPPAGVNRPAAPKASTTKTTRKAAPKQPEPEDEGDDQGDDTDIPF